MTGYVRQSTANIIAGQPVAALPLANELNAIEAAFNASTGHTHDGTTGSGPKIDLTNSVSGVLPEANGGTGGAALSGFVTLTGIENLTNKTITSPTITAPVVTGGMTFTGTFVGGTFTGSSLTSPTLTGVPVAPTATVGTNTTQVATTAFVQAAVSSGGGTYQPYDAGLASIAGLTTAANKGIYTTALDTYATYDLSAFARTLVDDADAATMRNTLGLGSVATTATTDYVAITGAQTITGLKDIRLAISASNTDYLRFVPTDTGINKSYLAIGTAASGNRWNLYASDGVGFVGNINILSASLLWNSVQIVDLSTAQTLTNKTLTSPVLTTPTITSPAITGGTISSLATDLAIADGGTGSSTASGARTNLGLVIGTDVQAYDAQLAALAAITPADGDFTRWADSTTAITQPIIGTVSQIGGKSRGALFETGSNANGTWIKYPDGTMITTQIFDVSDATTTADGSIFEQINSTTWNYPKAFVTTNPCVYGSTDARTRWVTFSSISLSTALWWHKSSISNSATTVKTYLTAIGRWY